MHRKSPQIRWTRIGTYLKAIYCRENGAHQNLQARKISRMMRNDKICCRSCLLLIQCFVIRLGLSVYTEHESLRSEPCPYPLRHQIYLRGKSGFGNSADRVGFRRGRTPKKKIFAPQQLTAGTINILPHFQIALQQSAFYIQFWKVESSKWYFVSQSRTLSDFVTVARREQWKEKTERSSGACFLTVFEDYV